MSHADPSSALEHEADLRALLSRVRTVAVVGVSPDPSRDSHRVAAYLLRSTGYDVHLVNPMADEILGRPVHPTLAALPVVPDLVDVFRRTEHLPKVLDDALAVGAGAFWTQLGLVDEEVARRASEAGLSVVMDRCLQVEHARLLG